MIWLLCFTDKVKNGICVLIWNILSIFEMSFTALYYVIKLLNLEKKQHLHRRS